MNPNNRRTVGKHQKDLNREHYENMEVRRLSPEEIAEVAHLCTPPMSREDRKDKHIVDLFLYSVARGDAL